MLDKLGATLKHILTDLKGVKTDVRRLSLVPVPKDGKSPLMADIVEAVLAEIPTPKDGHSPAAEDIVKAVLAEIPTPKDGHSPDIDAVSFKVLSQIPKPKDGKSPAIPDIVRAVLAEIPTPKDGHSPDASAIIKEVLAQIPAAAEPAAAPAPQKGDKGKDGKSITKVKLEKGNKLAVWLDGVRRVVGTIEMPKTAETFTPGSGGGKAGRAGRDAAPVAENIVVVNSLSDLITAPEMRITTAPNTEYQFGNSVKISSSYEMDIANGVVLQGTTQFAELYEYTGTGAAFNSPAGVAWEMRDLGYSCPNGAAFNCQEVQVFFSSSSRCYECDSVGTFTGMAAELNTVAFSDSVFANIKTSGMTLSGDFTQLTMRGNFMIATSVMNLIDWTGATFENLEIINLEPRGPAGTVTLTGDAGGVNIKGTAVAAIRDGNLDFGGITPLGGGLSKDDAAYSYSETGILNSKVVGHCYVTTPVTTDISAGVEVPVGGIYSEGSATSQTECSPGGVITLLNRGERHITVSVDLDIDKLGGGADDYIFRVKKIPLATGVPENVDGVSITRTIAGGGTDSFSVSGPSTGIKGDQFYVSVEGGTNDDIDANTSNFRAGE